jgi:hypothetical protein
MPVLGCGTANAYVSQSFLVRKVNSQPKAGRTNSDADNSQIQKNCFKREGEISENERDHRKDFAFVGNGK